MTSQKDESNSAPQRSSAGDAGWKWITPDDDRRRKAQAERSAIATGATTEPSTEERPHIVARATLHLVVEGQTEEGFVRLVLAPHLAKLGIEAIPRCVMTSRTRSRVFRGGLRVYDRARLDLQLWMQEAPQPTSWFTTMFDLYALPHDFPGWRMARSSDDPYRRVEALEKAFAGDIHHPRFIPYVQLHEYEALLLAQPSALEPDFPSFRRAVKTLVALRDNFTSPELINEGPETAPSKRLINAIPTYRGRKASAGPLAARRAGLATIRARCPHFNAWLTRLESLVA